MEQQPDVKAYKELTVDEATDLLQRIAAGAEDLEELHIAMSDAGFDPDSSDIWVKSNGDFGVKAWGPNSEIIEA